MVASRRRNGGGSEDPDGIDPARGVLLEEARTTLGEQLGQIDKIDEAAVRTVRLSVLLLGVLAGSATAGLGPGIGVVTATGMVGLIFAIVGAVTVYGTSTVYAGASPGELPVEYRTPPGVEETYVEVLSEYDAGIADNREALRTNGFVLGVSRASLVASVVLVLVGMLRQSATAAAVAAGLSLPATLTFILLTIPSPSEMSDGEEDAADDDKSIVEPVYLYTGPKPIADAKIRFGRWLREKGL